MEADDISRKIRSSQESFEDSITFKCSADFKKSVENFCKKIDVNVSEFIRLAIKELVRKR